MKILFFLLLGCTLFAHSLKDAEDMHGKTLNVGVFADVAYKTKDLYPRGVEGTLGYENHGTIEKVELNHVGMYLEGNYAEDFLYGFELNRHVDAPKDFDSYLEKLYIGYKKFGATLLIGRNYNPVSFVREKAWGYGFAQMPLAIDSFFDGTYIGDGALLNYSTNGLSFSFDYSQDKYNDLRRKTLYFAYTYDRFKWITYAQTREKSQFRINYDDTQHSHSHGSQEGCDNLDVEERCFVRDNKLIGVGAQAKFEHLELQGEYLYLHTEGEVSSSMYKIDNENKIHALYLQGIADYNNFLFGLRSELFMFSNNYIGNGAPEVAGVITDESANTTQYLHTIMGGYRFHESNRLIVQFENAHEEWGVRINYAIIFNKGL